MNIGVCRSTAGLAPLCSARGLYLRPEARATIKARLPAGGGSLSSWEAAERIREAARPLEFSSLRVVSCGGAEGLALEGEVEERDRLRPLVERLDGKSLRLKGFPAPLRLEAKEASCSAPTRHVWDAFFRDAADMDEMKAGERPDTIHLSGLPTEWFADDEAPSERVLTEVFAKFGRVRRVDAPACDPYRKRMKGRIATFESGARFECYVQFVEYAGFARAMEALRGKKLVKRGDDGVARQASVRVDFDRTKHLSDAAVKRRSVVRDRLIAAEEAEDRERRDEIVRKEEAERRRKDLSEKEKLTHTEERERKRKERQLAKLKMKEASEINSKIEREKKKLLKTQRKLQTIRLAEELFRRLEVKHKSGGSKNPPPSSDRSGAGRDKSKKEIKELQRALLHEKSSRDKLVSKYKNAQEQELEERRLKLQKVLEGKDVLRSVLEADKREPRASSISSFSSESDVPEYGNKDIKMETIVSPEGERFAKKELGDGYRTGYPPSNYNFGPYNPYFAHGYNYPAGPFYPRNGYYPEAGYSGRGRAFLHRRNRGAYSGRGYRGGSKISYFDSSDPNNVYYKYFKSLAGETGGYDNKDRSYSRSESRSRRRSYSRSRSSSYRSRSRSRSRRRSSSRRRSRYTRSRSYSKSRSKSRRSKSRSRNRHSRTRSKSSYSRRNRRSRTRSKSKTRHRSTSKGRSRSPSRHSGKPQINERSQSKNKETENYTPKKNKEQSLKENLNDKSPIRERNTKHKEKSKDARHHRERSKSRSLPVE